MTQHCKSVLQCKCSGMVPLHNVIKKRFTVITFMCLSFLVFSYFLFLSNTNTKDKKGTFIYVFITFALGIGERAYADVFLDAKPTSTMSASDAGKSKTPVFKCERVKQGPNINPVKVPGSKTIWAKDIGKGLENAGDLIADGKTIFRCKSMALDPLTARMKKAEESEE